MRGHFTFYPRRWNFIIAKGAKSFDYNTVQVLNVRVSQGVYVNECASKAIFVGPPGIRAYDPERCNFGLNL